MKKIIIYLSVCCTLLVSCTNGFEEMNTSPTSPSGAYDYAIFTNIISSLILGGNEQFYLSNEIFYPESELGALIADAWSNYTIGTEEVWSSYYYALADMRELEIRLDNHCEEAGDEELWDLVRAKLYVLRAYRTFKVTDMFGDIPYFEAGKIWQQTDNELYRKPPFDSQELIYKSLLEDLVWARDILNSGNTTTTLGNEYEEFSSADVLFYNNNNSWAKFANALILRHALRMYDKDPIYATPLIIDAYNGPQIEAYGDICMWPASLNWTNGSVHWSFREHNNLRMGETMWKCMSIDDTTTFENGIFDYRAYIFFDSNNKSEGHPYGQWVPFPQIRTSSTPSEGGSPYSDSRRSNYWFKPKCNYSPFNFYLIRDDSYIPEILFTSADFHLLKAEVMAKGIVSASLYEIDNELSTAIKYSFYFWNQMPDNSKYWTEFYPPYAAEMFYDIDTRAQRMASNVMNYRYYMSDPYILVDNEGYLKAIYEQRWINLFRQPWEAWALARSTHNTPTTTDYEKLVSNRMPYPPSEKEYNRANYDAQVATMPLGDTKYTPVWWEAVGN